jgi:hypothetical protein
MMQEIWSKQIIECLIHKINKSENGSGINDSYPTRPTSPSQKITYL